MFTGLVEAVGRVRRIAPFGGGARLTLTHPGWGDDLHAGASLAVDGCCLTVVDSDAETFTVEATRETLARTRFAAIGHGEPVNLERPLRVGDRVGGHWVQGHVDAVLPVLGVEAKEETRYIEVGVPSTAQGWVVPQGSIALNGVSLTVLAVQDGAVRVAIIPHTWASTNLSHLERGSTVHVEYDLLAKYVSAALRPGRVPA